MGFWFEFSGFKVLNFFKFGFFGFEKIGSKLFEFLSSGKLDIEFKFLAFFEFVLGFKDELFKFWLE